MNKSSFLSEHPAPAPSNAVKALNFGKKINPSQTLSFSEKLENASNMKTLERILLNQDKYQKLCAFRHETSQTSLREDHYYDFPIHRLLNDGTSLRIREDKDPNGEKRVALKFREKSIEAYLCYKLTALEVEEWEISKKTKIPASVFENSKIRPAFAGVEKVGFISSTRSLIFEGGVTLDNCSFSMGDRNFKDYEIRLKNPNCRNDLYSLMENKFLSIPVKLIEKSRYQRLMDF
ncbi:MAG: hypothetical protein KBD48_01050 [Candidatus Pacebacteria bacterium]|nr:hypothetical protein [Candidatus Paceibacterota bacterium]MBP9715765.1 hypothetical protein [Candidatus Paceibacterota bacterium]